MLWNAATHGLSIPRDEGAPMRQAQPNGGHTKRHGVLLPRRPRGSLPETPGFPGASGPLGRVADGVGARRVFLERRAPFCHSVFWASAQPCKPTLLTGPLVELNSREDGMAEQRKRDVERKATGARRRSSPVRTAKARGQSRGPQSARAERSASLAMRRRLVAPRTVLLQLKAIRRIATVLLRDVVALLAVLAGKGDLGANILRLASHFLTPLGLATKREPLRNRSGGGA